MVALLGRSLRRASTNVAPESVPMNLVRRRVHFDGVGRALSAPAAVVQSAHVFLLPGDVDVKGRTVAELLEISRSCQRVVEDYCLADYAPAYVNKLLADMETAQGEGRAVFLWDSNRALLLAGYPRLTGDPQPIWTDTRQWYRTAQNAFHHLHPLDLD
jgi:hypothetical protein